MTHYFNCRMCGKYTACHGSGPVPCESELCPSCWYDVNHLNHQIVRAILGIVAIIVFMIIVAILLLLTTGNPVNMMAPLIAAGYIAYLFVDTLRSGK